MLSQYYASDYVPREIYVPVDFTIASYSRKRSRSEKVVACGLRSAAWREARHDRSRRQEREARFEQRFRILKPDMKLVLEELQETLELPHFPARIESFDISHIQGAENVAGMVVCDNGKMNRSEYRKFRIRGVEGANDVASMHEVVTRRYRRLLEEGKPLPDLIMIDGKAQLNAAASAMSEFTRSDSDGRHRQAAAATQRRRVPVDERP